MPEFLLAKLKRANPSMRNRLLRYMGALAVLLLTALLSGLFLLGQLKSPREETHRALTFQLEAFRTDMNSLWRSVSAMCVHLSEDMTALIEEQSPRFAALNGSVDAIESLQEAMLEPLCQYARQADCSGAFVLLNASLTRSADSHSGIFVQRSDAEHTISDLLLYRGMADVGRLHSVMPHRKWAQEFTLSDFPGLADHLERAAAPLETACRTTGLLTLPGTSEQSILLTVPLLGTDGTVYGLCGFSVNQTYFAAHHAQPSGVEHLACVLASDTGGALDISRSLLTYPTSGFCFVPAEELTAKTTGALTAFSCSDSSFIGLTAPFTLAAGDDAPHTLAVLLPQSDYHAAMARSTVQLLLLLVLLLTVGIACCIFYTNRYFRPILASIDRVTAPDNAKEQPVFEELLPLSHKLRSHERAITALETEQQSLRGQMAAARDDLDASQAEVSRLAYLRKKEMDPLMYELFLRGYAELSDAERDVCRALATGMTPRQYAEQTGRALSTIETHRKNIYKKTDIHKAQHLQICYALMLRDLQ